MCTATGLPLAWQVRTARRNESLYVAPLIDAVHARGYQPETVAMDRGYDNNRVMDETRERGCIPIVALRKGRAIPLTAIPYGSPEWKRLYHRRVAVEREFGRLKHEYASPRSACAAWPAFNFTPTSASSRGSRSRSSGRGNHNGFLITSLCSNS